MSFYGPGSRYGILPIELPGGGTFISRAKEGFRQGLNKARMIQAQYSQVFQTPEGTQATASSKALEEAILAAWEDGVRVGAKIDALGPPIAPLSQAEYEAIKATDWGGSHKADDAANARLAEMQAWKDQMNGLLAELNRSLYPQLGDLITAYTVNIPSWAEDVQNLINAKLKLNVATVEGKVLQATKAVEDVKKAEAKLAMSTSKLSTGPSPMTIALVAVPLVGIAAYFLLRKKRAPSVGRYHRRRR